MFHDDEEDGITLAELIRAAIDGRIDTFGVWKYSVWWKYNVRTVRRSGLPSASA